MLSAFAVVHADRTRGELLYPPEKRGRCKRGPVRKRLVESRGINFTRNRRVGEYRLHFACEPDASTVLADVQGPDADPVAGENQAVRPAVPECQRPLAVEPREAPVSPFFVGVDNDLRVGARPETMSERLQVAAELDVIEDLAVEDDPERAVLVRERLLARDQVDDREPCVPEARARVTVGPAPVGTAVAWSWRVHHSTCRNGTNPSRS